MTHFYLLDTNIISELIKHPRGSIFSKIKSIGEEKICTSIIVACELRFGARKKKSPKLLANIEVILTSLEVLPLTYPVDEYYGKIRTYLEVQGTPIGANDLLIAAHALCLNLTVITNNISEFSRVPNLKVENWLNPE
ncbi:type II toxin-antitoxin system VapC family toxin [Crocosphaera sp.]|uniref:type II toxin-antitoxin system VapC family toxin n=1 Tax=Crocosphaera sp. TaxID=2729996 RepID=UPI00263113E3|nr:type II toxin-antitoxin system VapC family toxin [Crocosphaera sp.]MDJ0581446.1 type II toxin-antitoxin system VapC family toxin [Crocosphaera sp.]